VRHAVRPFQAKPQQIPRELCRGDVTTLQRCSDAGAEGWALHAPCSSALGQPPQEWDMA